MQNAAIIYREPVEVDVKLQQLALESPKLVSIGVVALAARNSASALHPANAPGTFAYHDGVEALRVEHMGRNGWVRYAVGGLEGIFHEELNLIVLFKNVDRCCIDFRVPQASRIGVNAEKISGAPLFEHIGADLPEVTYIRLPSSGNVKTSKARAYYLMVDPDGGIELSMPVIEGEQIKSCIERIYLSSGGELDVLNKMPDEAGPKGEDDFVIKIKRKNER